MAKHYTKLIIEINEDITSKVTAVKGDVNSRYLDVQLFNDSVPLDLTSHTVTMSAKSHPDSNFKVPINKFIDGQITEAINGRCQFKLETDILGQTGVIILQISVFSGEQEVLSTNPFNLYVIDGLRNDEQIEASNEFGALVVLFSEIQNALDDMNAIRENFGEPSQESIEQGILTFWEIIEQMRKDVSTAVAYDLPKKVGNPNDDFETETLFGKVNEILANVNSGVQVYDVPGEYNFQLPYLVKKVQLVVVGGGGGGRAGNQNTNPSSYGRTAGGGGGGACVIEQYDVNSQNSHLKIKVGKGGVGSKENGEDPTAGEASYVSGFVTAAGGGIPAELGGYDTQSAGGTSGGTGGGNGGIGSSRSKPSADGNAGLKGAGGTAGGKWGGGGGGGSYGKGGDGALYNTEFSTKQNGVYGGGGGSGAVHNEISKDLSGGNGGDGLVIIRWGDAIQ